MLERQGKLKSYNENEEIFNEGSYGEEFFVIKSGTVEIYRKRDNREVHLANLGEKDFFGELAFFGNYPRSASARAKSNAEIYIIDKDNFMKLINDSVVWLILKKLGDRIRETDDKIEDLIVKDQVRKENIGKVLHKNNWT